MEERYTIYLALTAIFFAVFYIINKYIKYYFELQKRKYAQESNFPIILAIGSLVAITVLILVAGSSSLTLFVEVINSLLGTSLTVTSNLNYFSLAIFGLFCCTLVGVIYFHTRRYNQEIATLLKGKTPQPLKITYPNEPEPESPIFHERIQELLELKFRNENLKLEYDKAEKILYGRYRQGLQQYTLIVYCDDSITKKQVRSKHVTEKRKHVETTLFPKVSKEGDNFSFYYLLENGAFEKGGDETAFTEDSYTESLIDFNRYLTKLVEDFNTKKLFSILEDEEKRLTLKETFISPRFNGKQESLDGYIDQWLNSASLKHFAIFGDYGMGKSSFLKYYSARLAREILEGKGLKRFPVFISLTNASPMHGGIQKSVEAFVARELGVNYALFQKLEQRGKVLYILDGFDEMGFIGTHESRFRQLNAIWQLATKNNKIIISGRPSYFPTDFELNDTLNLHVPDDEATQTNPYFEPLTLDRFELEQISESITLYYSKKKESNRYIEFIKKSPSIFDLCQRPSLMHIVREMLPSVSEELGTEKLTAGKLMSKYIEYWIDRQKGKKIVSSLDGDEGRKKTFILEFYKELATQFYVEGKLKMPAKDILEVLRPKFAQLPEALHESSDLLEGFESELLTGYFIEIEGDSYRFVHKSFFEFFVSQAITEKIKAKDFKHPLILKDWSKEIIDYIYDMNEVEQSNSEIPWLLEIAHSPFIAKLQNACFMLYLSIHKFSERWFLMLGVTFLGLIYFATTVLAISLLNIEMIGEAYSAFIGIATLLVEALLIYVISGIKRKPFPLKTRLRFITKTYQIAFLKSQFILKSEEERFIHLTRLLNNASLISSLENYQFQKTFFMNNSGICDATLKNVAFEHCYLGEFSFNDCELYSVSFAGSFVRKISFSRTTFQNVDFEKIVNQSFFSLDFFAMSRLIPVLLASTSLEFINIDKIDEFTLNSLRRIIQDHDLVIGEDISGDEWLMEELKKGIGRKGRD